MKELTQKYEALWEQIDVLYRETSELKEYIVDIDSKYDTLWAKCNANANDIIGVREHMITKGRVEPQPRCDKVESQIASVRFDIGLLQNKVRAIDKIEEDHISVLSNMSYDMYAINTNNAKNKEYIDNKFAKLYACISIVMLSIITYTLC